MSVGVGVGVGLSVGVGVLVGVDVGVLVGVDVGVLVGVDVGVDVGPGDPDGPDELVEYGLPSEESVTKVDWTNSGVPVAPGWL